MPHSKSTVSCHREQLSTSYWVTFILFQNEGLASDPLMQTGMFYLAHFLCKIVSYTYYFMFPMQQLFFWHFTSATNIVRNKHITCNNLCARTLKRLQIDQVSQTKYISIDNKFIYASLARWRKEKKIISHVNGWDAIFSPRCELPMALPIKDTPVTGKSEEWGRKGFKDYLGSL
jgi:hypothetical protein